MSSPSATTEEQFLLQKIARGLGSGNVDHRVWDGDFSDQDGAPAFPSLGQTVASLESAGAILLIGANPRKEHPIINHRLRKAENGGAKVMAINSMVYDLNYRLYEHIIAAPASMAEAVRNINGRSNQGKSVLAALTDADEALILLGPSVAAHPDGSAVRAAAAALAAKTGARLGQLPLGANAGGAWLAGAVPHRGAGGRKTDNAGRDALAMVGQGQSQSL